MTIKKGKLEYNHLKQITSKDPQKIADIIEHELDQIIIDIENSKLRHPYDKSLSNYLIIRLITIIENFMKNFVIELIDVGKFNYTGLFSNDEIVLTWMIWKKFKQIKP